MSDLFPPTKQRPALLAFAEALDSRPAALRRDECNDWRISGREGCSIYAVPEGFQLQFDSRYGVNDWDGEGPHVQDYAKAKRSLAFCNLRQDGTGGGIFTLDRLPNEAEASAIRETLGIFRKKQYSEEALTAMRERGQAWQKGLKTGLDEGLTAI
jgi:hypothetical protein